MYLGSPRMAEVVIGETAVARGDGRRAHARRRSAAAATTSAPTTTRRSTRRALVLSYLPHELAPRRRPSTCRSRRPRPRSRSPTIVPDEDAPRYDMHKVIDALVDDDSFFELKPLFAPRADHRVRPPRRAGRSASSPTTRCTSAACCSSTPPTRRRASSGCATRSTCRLLFLADVPGFMIGIAGRAGGDHPPRRQDDHRGRRGDGAEDLGDRAQGVRRRALRDVRPGVRPRRVPRAADRARSR